MDLFNELQYKIKELNISIKSLRETGTKSADADRDYKIALTKKVLELKEEKMPATLINLVIYGIPEIAELRHKRDVAEVIYNANQEAINSAKLQARIIENQLNREWNNTNN